MDYRRISLEELYESTDGYSTYVVWHSAELNEGLGFTRASIVLSPSATDQGLVGRFVKKHICSQDQVMLTHPAYEIIKVEAGFPSTLRRNEGKLPTIRGNTCTPKVFTLGEATPEDLQRNMQELQGHAHRLCALLEEAVERARTALRHADKSKGQTTEQKIVTLRGIKGELVKDVSEALSS